MKAGAALGLLAGLGAINALRGGRDGTGPRFTGLLDMIDGGGAGQSGDKFEGGGLLSMLGNLFAKPLEAQQNVERIAQNTAQDKAQAEVIKKVIEGQLSPKLDGKDGLLPAPTLSPRLDGKDGIPSSVAQTAAMEDAYPLVPSAAPELRQAAGTPTAPYEQVGAITDIRFGPRGEPTSLLDTRQQAPSPDEARALQAIIDGNMMNKFIELQPYEQKAMIDTMLQRGY